MLVVQGKFAGADAEARPSRLSDITISRRTASVRRRSARRCAALEAGTRWQRAVSLPVRAAVVWCMIPKAARGPKVGVAREGGPEHGAHQRARLWRSRVQGKFPENWILGVPDDLFCLSV